MSYWSKLSMKDRADVMKLFLDKGISDLDTIRREYNTFAEGGDTVGEWVDAIYQNNLQEEFLGEPSHHYDFTQSEEWANAHGYYPDARGHRDDRVKKPAHPSHPSRGTWEGDKFVLSELGMQNPNYTLFGLNDGGQDSQAILTYQGSSVIPEITATPNGNYIYNPYDNIKLKFADGGSIHNDEGGNTNYSYTRPLDNVYVDSEGNVLDPSVPSAKGTIRTPDVVIATRDPRKAIPTANGLNIPDASLELRRRFYDHITPAGYELPITRTVAAALNPGRVKTIEVNPQTRRGKTIYPGLISALRDDLFAEYLQIPKEERHKVIINAENNAYNSGEIEETSFRPTNAENDKYFKFKNLSNLEKDRLVKLGTPLSVGSNTLSGALRVYLGEHTIGHGHDTKGDYVSYYDNWDLAPFTGKGKDQSLGIGKPVHIYDRIYLDDYYGLPEEYRGSTYIPELTVTANKHADGGKIHIKPSHRGRLTELKKRTGKSEAELYKTGGPAVRKMITFARNARKWKHGLGGLLEI